MTRMWIRLSIIYTVIIFIVAIILVSIIALIRPDAPRIAQQLNLSEADRVLFVQLVENGVFEEAIRTAIFSQILGLFVLAISAGVLASAWASWLITRPLSVLDHAIHNVSKRDFTETVQIEGTYEVKSLAESFNLMVSELASAEKRRQNLLADVAHELRTPLTVIQGNLRGALDNIYTFDQERVANLFNQVRQLNHLIDDLHDLAQAEANQLQLAKAVIQLDKIVAQTVEIFTPLAADSDISLSTDIMATIPPIRGDRKRIMQVLQNLLSNAIRYADRQIIVRVNVDGDFIQLSVQDDGSGMSQDDLVHIFDRFYRADSSRARTSGGTGLGLAIVRSIVEAHQGTITVESALGVGTTFTIYLPLHET